MASSSPLNGVFAECVLRSGTVSFLLSSLTEQALSSMEVEEVESVVVTISEKHE